MENPLLDKFIDAVARLKDITTIRTNPNLANIRADLMRSNGTVSDEMVRVLEVVGIAKAVAARFSSTPQFYSTKWLVNHGAGAGYRAFLLAQFDWIHKYGTVCDGALVDASTCLCPVTAYLQLILYRTPIEDWAAAAAAEPDTSPLAFAWEWARTSPGIGRQTADVAMLVAMGRHVYRLMADAPVRAEELKSTAAERAMTRLDHDGISAVVVGAVKDYFVWAATRLRDSLSDVENYKRVLESRDDGEELLATLKNAAEKLGEEGDRYAQLLGKKGADQEREGVVISIRTLARFFLGKAEPPASEALLQATNGLAIAE